MFHRAQILMRKSMFFKREFLVRSFANFSQVSWHSGWSATGLLSATATCSSAPTSFSCTTPASSPTLTSSFRWGGYYENSPKWKFTIVKNHRI